MSISFRHAVRALCATASVLPLMFAPAALAQTPAPVKPKPAVVAPAPVQAAPVTQGAAPAKTSGEGVIARVGSTNIPTDEIRAYVAALGERDRAALEKEPGLLGQAVRMMLANRLVLQEIAAKKWDQQPKIAEQLDRVRENAAAELYLQSVSTPPSGFPSEEDLQKVYDANRKNFLMPRQYQLSQIFVAVPQDSDKAVEDKAKKTVDDAQRRLKSGTDFAAVANEINDTKNGGELGWVVESQIRPEIRSQIGDLAKNTISEPVKLDDGWHILKLVDTKAPYTRTLPEVREALVAEIRKERATAMRRAYLAELLKQHPPVINELALSNLLDETAKR